ncbi:hypothetical protein PanWU01x14_056860 [Parasponia andersonii]|uniref:Uncharacterized protein n=1 Tax=Parasponia andersonii TaxID=3476 RepID=A0A2P5DJM8_PARAD|nr:hypothetical protein PanWU01x14_056860 [Parasponia andersonii]
MRATPHCLEFTEADTTTASTVLMVVGAFWSLQGRPRAVNDSFGTVKIPVATGPISSRYFAAGRDGCLALG